MQDSKYNSLTDETPAVPITFVNRLCEKGGKPASQTNSSFLKKIHCCQGKEAMEQKTLPRKGGVKSTLKTSQSLVKSEREREISSPPPLGCLAARPPNPQMRALCLSLAPVGIFTGRLGMLCCGITISDTFFLELASIPVGSVKHTRGPKASQSQSGKRQLPCTPSRLRPPVLCLRGSFSRPRSQLSLFLAGTCAGAHPLATPGSSTWGMCSHTLQSLGAQQSPRPVPHI